MCAIIRAYTDETTLQPQVKHADGQIFHYDKQQLVEYFTPFETDLDKAEFFAAFAGKFTPAFYHAYCFLYGGASLFFKNIFVLYIMYVYLCEGLAGSPSPRWIEVGLSLYNLYIDMNYMCVDVWLCVPALPLLNTFRSVSVYIFHAYIYIYIILCM